MEKISLNFIYALFLFVSFFGGALELTFQSNLHSSPNTISGPVAKKLVSRNQRCPGSIVTSTIYNVPDEAKLCPRRKRCNKFLQAVRLNGSGLLRNGSILRANGKTENIYPCRTANGAGGTCLIPYISIAADYAHYRNGDIIEMPEVRGRRVQFPNGQILSHPGFFKVEDTGGAIKGVNRFDFFTGSLALDDPKNSFGQKAPPDSIPFHAKAACHAQKRFQRLARSSPEYFDALDQINKFTESLHPTPPRSIAQASNSEVNGQAARQEASRSPSAPQRPRTHQPPSSRQTRGQR